MNIVAKVLSILKSELMKTSDFNYDLPDELIAKYPLKSKSASRLLVYENKIQHKSFIDILDYLNPGDLLVLNNTSVIPARFWKKAWRVG